MDEFPRLRACRTCGETKSTSILNLGSVAYSGKFPDPGVDVESGVIELIQCDACGLAQLREGFNANEMFDEHYGYESHLNPSMSKHLKEKAAKIQDKFLSGKGEQVIVDIASNDGTLLSGYSLLDAKYVGIDPLAEKLSDFYPERAIKIPNFFSSDSFFTYVDDLADVVTSCSVLYDMEDPKTFVNQISEILKVGGIWHSEQSYLPSMVQNMSYDTICHEHILYLRLVDILNLLEKSDLQVIDVELNEVNGGSFAFTAIKSNEKIQLNQSSSVRKLLKSEEDNGFIDGSSLLSFKKLVRSHQNELKRCILDFKERGFDVYGLGASTKGNILLQSVGLDASLISAIGEVNHRKFGKLTPKSNIPIVPEDEVLSLASQKSVFLVLPWHFRESIIDKVRNGKKTQPINLLFPLPTIHVETI